MFVFHLCLNTMENISFEKEQFEAMTRVLKAEMIETCIRAISENNSVTIDNINYTKLSAFIY